MLAALWLPVAAAGADAPIYMIGEPSTAAATLLPVDAGRPVIQVPALKLEDLPEWLGVQGLNGKLESRLRLLELVTHLEALRRVYKDLLADRLSDPVALIATADARPTFAPAWRRHGLELEDFVNGAPRDWQILQLAVDAATSTQYWQVLDQVPLEASPVNAFARWSGTEGLGFYAVRASVATYFVRSFFVRDGSTRGGHWDVVRSLQNDGRGKLGMDHHNFATTFILSRSVACTSLSLPTTTPPRARPHPSPSALTLTSLNPHPHPQPSPSPSP